MAYKNAKVEKNKKFIHCTCWAYDLRERSKQGQHSWAIARAYLGNVSYILSVPQKRPWS